MALVVQIFSEGFELMMMHITHFTVLSAFNWQQKYALQKNLLMQELKFMVLNCSEITRENYYS